jgi:hypothetical protein
MRFARVLLLCAAFFALRVVAQSPNGTINGQVLDPSGGAIADAGIVIVNDVTGLQYIAKTNDEGIYVLVNLPPGPYRLQVSKVGFKTLIKPDIILNVQDALAISFTLPIGALAQTVTVEGGAPLVDTESSAVSTVIDRKFVENIPLNGRSFQDLISLTPGVVTQSPQTSTLVGNNGDFSVNGQRTESNYYMVDGVSGNISSGYPSGLPQSANTGSISASTAVGTTQSLISVDALQEFRVLSSTYSAQYGHSPGGQFSLVTLSGTNALHGSAFEYLRNDFFDANDWFNDHYGKPTSPLRQNDFGGTLGGPVILPRLFNGRNNTFFFVSYEGLRLTQPQAATIQYVPDTYMRKQAPVALQPILNAFPVPTPGGIDYGTAAGPSLAQFIEGYALPSAIDSTSVRVDHNISSRSSVFFRYGNTPSFTDNRSLSSQVTSRVDTTLYTFGSSIQFSPRISNEFRVGYSRSKSALSSILDSFGGAQPLNLAAATGLGAYASPDPLFQIYFPGIGGAVLQTPNATSAVNQLNIIDTGTFLAGHHQVTFGLDYRRIISPSTPYSPFANMAFRSPAAILNNRTSILVLEKFVGATPLVHESAVFAQDEWRVLPNLNLSFGVRWEVNPPPTEAHGNAPYALLGNIGDPQSLTLAPRGTPLWRTAWYNFAPRAGVAWTARDQPGWTTVLRGGGGVFFDTGEQQATNAFRGIGFSALRFTSAESVPIAPAQLAFFPSTSPPYTNSTIVAYPSHSQLPYTLEWNVSLEQAIANSQSLTLSYIGSSGRRLTQFRQLSLTSLNPQFGTVQLLQNGVTSDYEALQAKFRRVLSRGLQLLASYSWSHSLDFGSNGVEYPATRGNSDFDVRHSFSAGVSYDLPTLFGNRMLGLFLGHWGVDGRVTARSGFPVTLQGNFLTDPSTGNQYYSNADTVSGQPLYLHGPQYPGGWAINPAAFSLPAGNSAGNAPRNFVRGFGAFQTNLAVRREIRLHDRLALQLRAEAFNVFNHPIFGNIDSFLGDATFGQATEMLNHSLGTLSSLYQQGGPRSLQFALRLIF